MRVDEETMESCAATNMLVKSTFDAERRPQYRKRKDILQTRRLHIIAVSKNRHVGSTRACTRIHARARAEPE